MAQRPYLTGATTSTCVNPGQFAINLIRVISFALFVSKKLTAYLTQSVHAVYCIFTSLEGNK